MDITRNGDTLEIGQSVISQAAVLEKQDNEHPSALASQLDRYLGVQPCSGKAFEDDDEPSSPCDADAEDCDLEDSELDTELVRQEAWSICRVRELAKACARLSSRLLGDAVDRGARRITRCESALRRPLRGWANVCRSERGRMMVGGRTSAICVDLEYLDHLLAHWGTTPDGRAATEPASSGHPCRQVLSVRLRHATGTPLRPAPVGPTYFALLRMLLAPSPSRDADRRLHRTAGAANPPGSGCTERGAPGAGRRAGRAG
jgi:hypothetical protein